MFLLWKEIKMIKKSFNTKEVFETFFIVIFTQYLGVHKLYLDVYIQGFSYKSVPKIIFKWQSFPIN